MASNLVKPSPIQQDFIKIEIAPEYSEKVIKNTIIETNFNALVPNTIYNVYELKDNTKGISSNNIMYFKQVVSDENGRIYLDDIRDGIFAVKAMRTLFNPVITVPEMYCDGTDQEIVPTVTINGMNLVKDVDYIVSGDYIFNDVGMYVICIEGISEWSGTAYHLVTVDKYAESVTTTTNIVTTDKITGKTGISNTTTVNVSSTTISITTDITTETSLPQTGNNSFKALMAVIAAFVLIISGSLVLSYFGMKEDEL